MRELFYGIISKKTKEKKKKSFENIVFSLSAFIPFLIVIVIFVFFLLTNRPGEWERCSAY